MTPTGSKSHRVGANRREDDPRWEMRKIEEERS